MTDGRTLRASGIYVAWEHDDLGDDDYHQVVHTGTRMLTRNGALRHPFWGGYEWHTLVCNNGNCSFYLMVREDRLVEILCDHLEQTGEGR